MATENGRLGTPVFYKFIVGVFTLLFVTGVAGIWDTGIRLTRIEVKLEHIEKKMLDRFSGRQGAELKLKVEKNTDNMKILADKLHNHLLWAAKQEK